MDILGLGWTLVVLAVNIWGLALAVGIYWRNRWFALATGPWVAVTGLYAIECHAGLGPSLPGLCFISSFFSTALILMSTITWSPFASGSRASTIIEAWRAEFAPRRFVGCLGVSSTVFMYAMLWRITFPNVDGSSEKLADLSFISSYYSGETIPVTDAWLAPLRSTQYYSFQHYGASLLGRVLDLPIGAAYNIGFCLLIALASAAFAGAVSLVSRKFWVRFLLTCGFVFGGTGATLLVHLTEKHVNPWTSMRFIGSAPMDRAPVGAWMKSYQSSHATMDLPGEPFAYSIYLGDYHAPLSGYYLLGLGTMAGILAARGGRRRYAVIMGATVTWTLLSNAWVLPLQMIAVGAWLVFNYRRAVRFVTAAAAGALAVGVFAWPYLSAFAQSAAGYGSKIRWVPTGEHTPPLEFVLFLLPTIGLICAGFACRSRAAVRLAVVWLVLLLMSEFLYVDDLYSGVFDRFNTTLKWWPWIAAGTLMTLGPIVLEQAGRRWVRTAGAVLCLYPCFFVLDLAKAWREGSKEAAGHLSGDYFITRNEVYQRVLTRLSEEDPGIAVERPEPQGDFTNSDCLPLFAGQKMWLGWVGHEQLWRGFGEDVVWRFDRLFELYQGRMSDAGNWLRGQGIDYVLWYRPGDSVDLWSKVNASIEGAYSWTDVLPREEPGRRAGYWRRIRPK